MSAPRLSSEMLTTEEMRPIVLDVLFDGERATRREIHERIVTAAQIPPEQLQERLSSGQLRYENRMGWAITGLTQAGLLERVSRAVYRITDRGRQFARENQGAPIRESDFIGLPKWDAYQEELAARRRERQADANSASARSGGGSGADADGAGDAPPGADNAVETVQELVEQENDAVATELLNRLREESPEFFEEAVVRTLKAMGYGGSERLGARTDRGPDGGIDGVIPQDPLGLQNVYVQAKRYAADNTVGSSAIHAFYGAVSGKGVDRGIFFTTSHFTDGAIRYARDQMHGKVVLVDGRRLTSLMLRYGVGVQVKHEYAVLEIDEDFFDL
ncbi:MAG: restriction endonuclease [Bowdeniella nasicola]|nr:restriction endonuclease [Bowdeniella nasicola]